MEMVTQNQREPEHGMATSRQLKEAGRPAIGIALFKDLIICRRHSISPSLEEDKGRRVGFGRYSRRSGLEWRQRAVTRQGEWRRGKSLCPADAWPRFAILIRLRAFVWRTVVMMGLSTSRDRGGRRFGCLFRRLQQRHHIFIEFHYPQSLRAQDPRRQGRERIRHSKCRLRANNLVSDGPGVCPVSDLDARFWLFDRSDGPTAPLARG
jgi:hypothetical protein